jgi:uridine kinase
MIIAAMQIRGMHTLIRDAQITKHDFVFYSDRLIRLVSKHASLSLSTLCVDMTFS